MRIFVVIVAATAASLFAQEPAPTPEIRRALPANPAATPEVRRAQPINADNYENPAWMNSVPRAEPVNPTEPANPAQPANPTDAPTPPPASTPTPTPTPIPVAPALPLEPEETPTPEPAAVPPGQEPPTAPAVSRSLLAANGFYRRKMYDMAVYDFEKFLVAEPQAPSRDVALFRLGESHRFLGNTQAARDAYQRLLTEFPSGEFVGAGAYRLGEIFYAEGNAAGALDMFQKAEANTKEPAVKLSAQYFRGNALVKLGRRAQAIQQFNKVIETQGDNPYRETAQFFLAEEAARTGRKQDAFNLYEKLSTTAAKPEMQAEATVKAAALAGEMGQSARAEELFEKALKLPAIGDWRGVAQLGLLRLAYDSGDYKRAAELTDEGIRDLPAASVPEALLLSANAARQLGKADKALEIYDRLVRDYPQSDSAGDARFQRLVCLEATGSPDLAKQLDDFLAVSTDPRERAQATLLKAETVFKTGDYKAAAPLYASVLRDVLPARLRNQARYKLGWCQLQLQQYGDAVKTFTVFIEDNPTSDLLPSALLQRAIALQQGKSYDDALRDFDRVVADFPKAKEREVALQQKALILGQQEKYDAMVKTFQQLLDAYPKSKATAQAEYWIGWAAFEKKDYKNAIGHLKKARELDAKAFGEGATQRIVFILYTNEDRAALAAEVANAKPEALPTEVLAWLGSKCYDEGDYKKAEEYLAPAVARSAANPDVMLELAKARLAQKKYEAARDPIQIYISQARDPLSRAKGLLASAEISLGTGNYEDANKLVDEALVLQPEGHYNAEGRLLAGQVLVQRGDYEEAAKAFMTISVLYDDKEITPQALEQAAGAYKKAGNETEARKALDERKQRYPDAAKPRTSTDE
ncbi:MAG: tetratricopeptide repeat protein [Chthoniobacterales bacterium]